MDFLRSLKQPLLCYVYSVRSIKSPLQLHRGTQTKLVIDRKLKLFTENSEKLWRSGSVASLRSRSDWCSGLTWNIIGNNKYIHLVLMIHFKFSCSHVSLGDVCHINFISVARLGGSKTWFFVTNSFNLY